MRSLDLAVLGLVARRPATGYEVAARMRNPVGYYWAESHGGIYPALRRVLEAGWVTVEAAPGPGPRDKRVYTATPAGVAALGTWAAEAPADPPVRDELVLKVSSLWAAQPAAAVAMLVAEADRWEKQRLEYAGIVAALADGDPEVGSAGWFGLQTARRGEQFARGRGDWCRGIARDLAARFPAIG
jgi:DNA-binding PadR family transcriptional regulator